MRRIKAIRSTVILSAVLVVLAAASLFIGVIELPLDKLLAGDLYTWEIFLISRLPRLLAILCTGIGMSVAGLIMQQLCSNKFVLPTTGATISSAQFGILLALLFMPASTLWSRVVFAAAILGTWVFVWFIQRICAGSASHKILSGISTEIEELTNNDTGRQNFTKQELCEKIADIEVLFSGWGTPTVDYDVLQHAKKLKVHAHTGGSVASYVSKEEYDRGIRVISGNDIFAKSVAEGCLCYTLTALRRNEEFLNSMHAGGWRLPNGCNKGLLGKKIGIVGDGAISKYYMQLLSWFEPELYIASRYASDEEVKCYGAKKSSLQQIFSDCDVISLHAAWNRETENMITEELLELIKPGALFVNTARAQLVDEEVLYKQLRTGRFKAVLDVYHTEPLPEEDELRKMPNVQLYPHMGGPTFDMREQVTLRLIEDIENIFSGNPYRDEIPYDYAIRMSVN